MKQLKTETALCIGKSVLFLQQKFHFHLAEMKQIAGITRIMLQLSFWLSSTCIAIDACKSIQ